VVKRNDMIGSTTKVVFGMLMDALVLSVRAGRRGNMMMTMIVTSELCG
jgi:hypothetical protein